MKTLTRGVLGGLLATFAVIALAANANAAWSGSNNIGAGQYNYFWYGDCHFGGLNNSVTATTQWVAGEPEGCIGLRVRYQYDVPGYPVGATWTGYAYSATPTTPSVNYSKSSTQRMLASGHSGRI